MTYRFVLASASALALALSLTACGGGGGGGERPVVTLPVLPPPPPPPAPPVPPPPPFGLTADQAFVTAGVVHSPPSTEEQVEFSWSNTAQAYTIKLPGQQPTSLELFNQPGNRSTFVPAGNGTGDPPFQVHVSTGVELSYTGYAHWHRSPAAPEGRSVGVFAFGIPTAASEIPVTGTGTYSATVQGDSTGGYGIGGEAQLTFDFGAGTLQGWMQPRAYDGWGMLFDLDRYEFTQTVFGVGSSSFSGRFNTPDPTAASFFEGGFTGPGATELLARWQAPYRDPYYYPDTWGTMQGIWVGRRQ
jgi:hypothetical protein